MLPYLSDYLAVPRMFDEDDTLRRASAWLRGRQIERVEAGGAADSPRCPDARGLGHSWNVRRCSPGLSRQADHEGAGRRGWAESPYSARATSVHQIYEAADRIGFPLIIKPIDGAGSADTYRVDSPDELDTITPRLQHVPEVSVEEFIDGEEFTYDTICIDGRPAFENVAQYLPRPLIARTEEWISRSSSPCDSLSSLSSWAVSSWGAGSFGRSAWEPASRTWSGT